MKMRGKSLFPILENGCWFECISTRSHSKKSALFLDRDGVVILDTGYIHDPENVNLVEGAGDLINRANNAGMHVCLITNQSGIGRGMFLWSHFNEVQNRMFELLEKQNGLYRGGISLVAACPYHPTEAMHGYCVNHEWRKPNTGMIDAACKHLGIKQCMSIFVGDQPSDIQAARSSGILKRYIISSNYEGHDALSVDSLFQVSLTL